MNSSGAMDAAELARWTRFAVKGGIGTCTAVKDCVAEQPEDLMFLKDDPIVVLMQYPDQEGLFLGHCEGVVGRFYGSDVRFHGKLKKPVMTRRSSATTPNSPLSLEPSPTTLRPKTNSLSASTSSVSLPASPKASLPTLSTPPSRSSPSTPLPPVHPPSRLSTEERRVSARSRSLSSPKPDAVPSTSGLTLTSSETAADEEVKTPNLTDMAPLTQSGSLATNLPTLAQPAKSLTDHQSPIDNSYIESEPSMRVSVAMSDGEFGIGLSLLQDLVNGGESDDWSSTHSGSQSRGESRTPENETLTVDDPEYGPPTPIAHPASTVSEPKDSPSHSPVSTTFSSHRSETQGDWEGAADIYDDYRYSRQSMASKMSRLSMLSMHTGSKIPPPVPSDPMPTDGRVSLERKSTESSSSFYAQPTKQSSLPPTKNTGHGHVPTPLDLSAASTLRERLAGKHVPSPLLHGSFASPLTSPDPTSSGTSVYLAAYPSPGPASALRQRFESQRSTSALSNSTPKPSLETDKEFGKGRGIVIDDDEEAFVANPAIHSSPEPISPASSPSSSPELEIAKLPPLIIANRTPTPSMSHSPIPPSPEPTHQSTSLHPSPPRNISTSATSVQPRPVPTPQASPSPQPQGLAPPGSSQFIPGGPAPESAQLVPLPPSASPSPVPQQQLQVPAPVQPRTPSQQSREPGQAASRQSLFLPHPNAPRPPASASGPMYARSIGRVPPQQLAPSSSMHAVHTALANQIGPNGVKRAVTIYGLCERDLASSIAPVPITFSLEPPMSIPANRMGASSVSSAPRRAATAALETSPAENRVSGNTRELGDGQAEDRKDADPRIGDSRQPRRPRPRSRSFSGFGTDLKDVPIVSQRSSEDGSNASSPASPTQSRGRVLSGGSSSLPKPAKPSPLRSSHSPSPLSAPHNNLASPSRPSLKPASSPLSSSSLPTAMPVHPPSTQPPINQSPLRKGTSISETSESAPNSRPSISVPAGHEQAAPRTLQPHHSPSVVDGRNSVSSGSVSASPALRARTSLDTVASQQSDSRSRVISPPPAQPIVRNSSLKSKLSLPNLRGKNVRNRQDETSSPASGHNGSGGDNETMQVQDMDFELIRPSLPQFSAARSSEDSSRDASADTRPEMAAGFLRTASPTVSVSSGANTGQPSPTIRSEGSPPLTKAPKVPEAETSMDAHRQRELKWVSLMSTVPPAQAKKNKKIKKLLLEGVPSSVRYLVWAHLTDSKARGVPGVYSQLCKREQVSVSSLIERDIKKCFADNPRLQGIQEPLLSLLHAYITMVPDVQYQAGLTMIAGHLLLLAPEEDAFWIFVSAMDAHLRPYFSSNVTQMEVDAALFSKALESNDPPLAKYILVDQGITPATICRPWFSALFAGVLPVEYLHRVWDIVLFEGFSFLLRVGLAITLSCRRQIFHSTSEQALLQILLRPSITTLPTSSDSFISSAFAVKLKDDDVRKQRVKMEAQMKRAGQSRSAAASASISLPRS